MSAIGTATTTPGRAAVVACCGLLGLFAVLSYSAALTKSATYDEPMHALAGWLKLHRGDSRLDYESLPLPTRWAALANPADAIKFNASDENWVQVPNDTYRGFALVTDTLYRTAGNDGAAFINRSRFMMTLIGIALGALVITWAWKLGGAITAVVAATMFCLDPNLLGHASLVTTDLAVTLAMAGAVLATWCLGRRLTVLNSLLLCLALAAGINTKFSALLLWPVLLVLLAVRVLHPSPWIVINRPLSRRRDRLGAACVVVLVAAALSVLGTWAAHGFRFGPSPDPSIQLGTHSYRYELILSRYRREHPQSGAAAGDPAGTIEQLVAALDRSIADTVAAARALDNSGLPGSLRTHLQSMIEQAKSVRTRAAALRAASGDGGAGPELRATVRGAEYQLAFLRYFAAQPQRPSDPMLLFGTFLLQHHLMPAAWTNGLMVQYSRSKVLNSYLLGQVRHGGTWEFFPVALAVKMPVATVIALLGAAALALALLRSRWAQWSRWAWPAACVLVPPILFLAMAMTSDFNIGLRHIFPVYPFMYVGAAWVIGASLGRWGRPAHVAAGMLAVLLAGETLSAWPNYIAYFNVAAGGSRGGIRLLGDSNLDWGQDLPALAQWQKQHPHRPVALAYFGMVDPAFYGIRYDPLPPWPPPPGFAATHVLAVSATHLQGIFDERYAGYRQLPPPAEVLGGTIYLFDDFPR
jgi:hypothetical protein